MDNITDNFGLTFGVWYKFYSNRININTYASSDYGNRVILC